MFHHLISSAGVFCVTSNLYLINEAKVTLVRVRIIFKIYIILHCKTTTTISGDFALKHLHNTTIILCISQIKDRHGIWNAKMYFVWYIYSMDLPELRRKNRFNKLMHTMLCCCKLENARFLIDLTDGSITLWNLINKVNKLLASKFSAELQFISYQLRAYGKTSKIYFHA